MQDNECRLFIFFIVACNCNGHSRRCRFNKELYLASNRRSGGVCVGCQHKTAGRHCHYCQKGFYRSPSKHLANPQVCKGTSTFWSEPFSDVSCCCSFSLCLSTDRDRQQRCLWLAIMIALLLLNFELVDLQSEIHWPVVVLFGTKHLVVRFASRQAGLWKALSTFAHPLPLLVSSFSLLIAHVILWHGKE